MLVFTNVFTTSCFFFPTEFRFLSSSVLPSASIAFVPNSRWGWSSHHMVATERRCALLSSKGMFFGCSGFVTRCKDLDREGDFSLEEEILEFMKSSRDPEAFPSKKDLIEAGREDLVDAIVKKGGWLCLGWNLDEEEYGGIGQFCLDEQKPILATDWDSFKCDERQRYTTPLSSIASSSSSSSFTGRSLETDAEHESGIEGMLNRLEKERNATFGAGKNDLHPESTAMETVADLRGSTISTPLSANQGKWSDFGGYLTHGSSCVKVNDFGGSVSPEVQRSWNTVKTDLEDEEFEASEIALSGEVSDVLRYETLGYSGDPTNSNSEKEMNHDQLRRQLQNMELELSSVIGSLKSNASLSEKGQNKSSDDLLELSDAFEFQENEILTAKDKLRSIRAKIAVIEGKMALTIIDAQKVIEEKQKRINCAR